MKKQPKLVLRESCVYDVSKSWAPGHFVEMGAGTGHMTRIFLDLGFSGAAHDLGSSSRQMMRDNLADMGDRMIIVDDLSELPSSSFDYLLAFEVLEHIERDAEVLHDWLKHLKPGGRILISVPAHQRKFGRSDELVGHVRRYEKAALRALLSDAGIDDIRIVNYGFPITELTRRLSNRMVRDDRSYEGLNAEERSIRSAQAKPRAINRMLSMVGGNVFLPFRTIQRWFYGLDLGDGYVACGVKRAD